MWEVGVGGRLGWCFLLLPSSILSQASFKPLECGVDILVGFPGPLSSLFQSSLRTYSACSSSFTHNNIQYFLASSFDLPCL